MKRKHHRNARHVGAVVYVDLTSPGLLMSGGGEPQRAGLLGSIVERAREALATRELLRRTLQTPVERRLGEHGRARDLSEVARPLEQLTRLRAPHQLCAPSRLGVFVE